MLYAPNMHGQCLTSHELVSRHIMIVSAYCLLAIGKNKPKSGTVVAYQSPIPQMN